MVDIIVLVILLLILWKPFEWVAKRLILRAIRLWNAMDGDVEEISDELEKARKPCPTPTEKPCKCGTPCDPVTPSEPEKAKKDKTKKGV